jgi:hypothetical protein
MLTDIGEFNLDFRIEMGEGKRGFARAIMIEFILR